MARNPRLRPPELPPVQPAAPSVALAPTVGTGQLLHPTEAEDEERRQFIEGLFLAGAPYTRIVQLATQPPVLGPDGKRTGGGLGIGKGLVKHYLAELRQTHALFAAESEKTKRSDQLARLRNHLMRMASATKPPWASIQSTEKLIAEIEGNLAPRRLQVELHAVPDALAAAVAGMTPADIERQIAEELEREKKLAAIDTTASSVP